jgi:hypothetical protein
MSASKLILKKHQKFGCVYHKESMLVFKNEKERVVTGQIVDDELVPLDEESISKAKKLGFRVEETKQETKQESKPEVRAETDDEDDDEAEEEEDDEEEDQPAVKETPREVVVKETVKEPVAKETVKETHSETVDISDMVKLLDSTNKKCIEQFTKLSKESQILREKVHALESELETQKKLNETQKKKIKSLLATIEESA